MSSIPSSPLTGQASRTIRPPATSSTTNPLTSSSTPTLSTTPQDQLILSSASSTNQQGPLPILSKALLKKSQSSDLTDAMWAYILDHIPNPLLLQQALTTPVLGFGTPLHSLAQNHNLTETMW